MRSVEESLRKFEELTTLIITVYLQYFGILLPWRIRDLSKYSVLRSLHCIRLA